MKITKLLCILSFCVFSVLSAMGFPPADDDYLHAVGNKLTDKDGHEVWLTGVNWYGFETYINVAQGLTDRNYKDIVNITAELGFNILRIPVSLDLVYKWKQGSDVIPADVNKAVNPELAGKSSLYIFDAIIAQCKAVGLKVMPDIHNVMPGANEYAVWYDSTHPYQHWVDALCYLAGRYKNDDTVIMLDLKNEPHGTITKSNPYAKWDGSQDANNFKYACEKAAKEILAVNPNLVLLVEGIEVYPKEGFTWATAGEYDFYGCWWGGNLRGVKDYPVNIGTGQNQLVYSPHDYGPSVYPQTWFYTGFSKATLLEDVWRPNWYYIYEQNTAPLLIGEWGGPLEGDNLIWMTALRDFIKEKKLHHTFWCINRSSIGTDGIFIGGNWESIDQTKIDFLKPTIWQDKNGKFVGLDHQVILASHKKNCMDTHTNVNLYYGGTVITPIPTPSPTPIPHSPYYGQIKVLYKCGDVNIASSQMKPQFNILNNADDPIAMSDLTIRYYFSKDNNIQDVFTVDYASIGTSNVSCQFNDGFAAVNFTTAAGTLAAQTGQSGEIQVRFNQTNGANYNQADDYSFNAAMTAYKEWNHVLLLYKGALVWGIEPGETNPTPTPTSTPNITTPSPAMLKGDVNNDGDVNIIDALLIAQYSVEIPPAVFYPAAADVNNSGSIDIIDALLVAKYAVGLIDTF